MASSRALPSTVGAALVVGVGGGLAATGIEGVAVGAWAPRLAVATLALVGGAGLALALLLAAGELVAERIGLSPRSFARAALRAAPTVLALLPVGRHLFDGGFASTLPGAASAPLWLPLVGWATAAALLYATMLWLDGLSLLPREARREGAHSDGNAPPLSRHVRPSRLDRARAGGHGKARGKRGKGRGGPRPKSAPRRRSEPAPNPTATTAAPLLDAAARHRRALLLAAIAAAALVVVEAANRGLYASGYAEVHALLSLVAVAAAGVALHLALPPLADDARARRLLLGAAAATGVCLIATAAGSSDRATRWAIATRGTDARALLHAFGPSSGGASADDAADSADDARLPRPVAAAPSSPLAAAPTARDGGASPSAAAPPTLATWRASPAVARLLAATRGGDAIVVLVDALRADQLAPTDENRRDFPHLMALADVARRFDRAYATAAGTDLSVPTILTGRLDPWGRAAATLPEALAAAGRRTHAVFPSEMLRWVGPTIVTRGFDSIDRLVTDPDERDVGNVSTSARVTDLGLRFLDGAVAGDARPAFLWLHYFDVHEHDQLDWRDAALRAAAGALDDSSARAMARDRRRKYRAAVAVVDREVGRLVDGLKARGRWERATLVLVSDHGESLGEDARLPSNHGNFVYEPLVRVPLLVRAPSLPPGLVEHPASLVDVAPTLRELLGAGTPPSTRADAPREDGESLLPWLVSGAPDAVTERARPLVMNESQQHAILDWPWKLLVRPVDGLIELYDVARDPAEQNDRSDAEPARVRSLRRLYAQFPPVRIDRTLRGRRLREQLLQGPPPP